MTPRDTIDSVQQEPPFCTGFGSSYINVLLIMVTKKNKYFYVCPLKPNFDLKWF